MILRKPYGLLIKNFRIIHFILSILIGYIVFRTNNLLYFLNSYIQRGYFDKELKLVTEYTNIHIFLIAILVIIITLIIYLLMRFKDKPRLVYFISIIIYMAVFIAFIRAYSNLSEMQTTVIDSRTIRLTRDIILILSFLQYFVIANMLFTATGFNIKKFDFQEDLEELNISEEDEEEFEFVFGFDADEFKIKLRNKLRNMYYILVENKYVILIVTVLFAALITGYTILNVRIFNKIYSERQLLKTYRYELKILDSYVTENDYMGNRISDSYNYIVVKLNVKNLTNNLHELGTSTIALKIGNKDYYPINIKYELFKDLGKTHVGQTLPTNVLKTHILIYEVEKKLSNKSMSLKVISSLSGNEFKYKRISISPKNLDITETVKEVELNQLLEFNESILRNTKLTINDFEIREVFIYEYELCIMNECNQMKDYVKANTMTRYDKTLLKLDTNFELDKNLENLTPKDVYELIENFGQIRYRKNNKIINHDVNINNMTPKYFQDNSIFIDVLKELEQASEIYILFKVRNKQYIYKIK